MTKVKLTKCKCDHCMFEAKSMRGIKTHTGHMHKDLEETVESTHAIQIYKWALCDNLYNNKEELERHEDEHLNPTDTTCLVCDHQFYDQKILNRHNELYSWECLSRGECLKSKKDECCKESCRGAEHRVPK